MLHKSFLILSLCLVLIGAVFCAGCIEQDPVIGTWDTKSWIAGATSVITFNGDGTGVIEAEINGFPEGRVSSQFIWKNQDGEYYVGYDTAKKDDMKKTNIKFSGENNEKMTFDTVEYTKTK